MAKDEKKAALYVYVESDFPAPNDGWVKTNIELEMNQYIQKLSWRAEDDRTDAEGRTFGGWGSNNVTITKKDMDTVIGQLLTLCDAMLADTKQRDAWKRLIRDTIHKWHDDKIYRYELDSTKYLQ